MSTTSRARRERACTRSLSSRVSGRLRSSAIADAHCNSPRASAGLGHERSTVQFVSAVARDAATRDRIFARADGRIEIRAYYEPLHQAPAFEALPRLGELSVTEDVGSRIISLPMAVDLTHDEIAEVVDVVAPAAR